MIKVRVSFFLYFFFSDYKVIMNKVRVAFLVINVIMNKVRVAFLVINVIMNKVRSFWLIKVCSFGDQGA